MFLWDTAWHPRTIHHRFLLLLLLLWPSPLTGGTEQPDSFNKKPEGQVRNSLRSDNGKDVSLPPWYQAPEAKPGSFSLGDVGVYLRTYPRDALIAAYAVLSIVRNFNQVREIVVVTPMSDLTAVFQYMQPILQLAGETFYLQRRSCAPSSAKIRLVPVGCGLYGKPGSKYWKWDSRHQLLYDVMHIDLYVTSPVVLYMESDTLLTRKVQPSYLFHDGKPVVEFVTLAHLCRSIMRAMNHTRFIHTCHVHETTAKDAGTLVGAFNIYDTERRIPLQFVRAMFPALRARVQEIHGDIPTLLDFFVKYSIDRCNSYIETIPMIWSPWDKVAKFYEAIKDDTPFCLMGLSKPHCMGTFAVHFAPHLHHLRDLEFNPPGEYFALQLLSHNLFDSNHNLRPHVREFLKAAVVDRIPNFTELDPSMVRTAPQKFGLHPGDVV